MTLPHEGFVFNFHVFVSQSKKSGLWKLSYSVQEEGLRVLYSRVHILALPFPTRMVLKNFLAVSGIHFSKARKL